MAAPSPGSEIINGVESLNVCSEDSICRHAWWMAMNLRGSAGYCVDKYATGMVEQPPPPVADEDEAAEGKHGSTLRVRMQVVLDGT